VWAPVTLDVSHTNPEIAYSWTASPDGTFASTEDSYLCASEGHKALTVTATYQGASAAIDVTVTCNECFGIEGPCGDGIVGLGEECDNTEPWCVACLIDPICGDGVLHDLGFCAACDEECDDGNLADGDGCSSMCAMELPTCLGCLNALPDVGPFNAEFCEGDPLCVAVRDCALTRHTFEDGRLPAHRVECGERCVSRCPSRRAHPAFAPNSQDATATLGRRHRDPLFRAVQPKSTPDRSQRPRPARCDARRRQRIADRLRHRKGALSGARTSRV
jgi:cysteine-rich repeat protein